MIIGICGLIGSGKDTIAQYLIDSRGYNRVSFATTLKDATAVLFGWDREILEGATAEMRAEREKPDPFWTERLGREWSPRIALQYLGTDLFRNNLNESVWVYAAERRILNLGPSANVVISDVRFPNEIKMIRNMGGQIWWVRRGELPEWWEAAKHVTSTTEKPSPALQDAFEAMRYVHYSEWAWVGTNFDAIFNNDSTLAALYQSVETYMEGGNENVRR